MLKTMSYHLSNHSLRISKIEEQLKMFSSKMLSHTYKTNFTTFMLIVTSLILIPILLSLVYVILTYKF
jgi:hypothetical protein